MNQRDNDEIAILEVLKPDVYIKFKGRDIVLSENVVFGVLLVLAIALLGVFMYIAAVW